MRGPTGVADADFAGRFVAVEGFGEIGELTGTFHDYGFAMVGNGDAGGVITAVFHPA